MDTMQTTSDPVGSPQSLFVEEYPMTNDFDLSSDFMDEFFADFSQGHPIDEFEIADTKAMPHEESPSSDSKHKPAKIQRPLLPRNPSQLALPTAPIVYAPLPNGCADAAINAGSINDIYNRLMTMENTGPTFRQMSVFLDRVTAIEARLNAMEARHSDLGSRQASLENRQATIETRQTDMDRRQGDLSGRFEQSKVRMMNNITGLHNWCLLLGAHANGGIEPRKE